MRCPKCKTSLKKVNVNVQDARTKAISYQCGKCGYFRFEPKSAEKVVKEVKKMQEELYDDVMEEEPDYSKSDKKIEKKFDKRLRKSIGWIEPLVEEDGKMRYDVVDGIGSGTTFDSEENARIYSEVVQINKRLKRIEKKMNVRM